MWKCLLCKTHFSTREKIGPWMATRSHFSRSERMLLRKSWDMMKQDMEEIAVRIFEMIFELSPEAKKMFPFMKVDRAAGEKHSAEFAFHALRFMQVLESAVEMLDDPTKLKPVLSNLGRIHARQQRIHGFDSHYWSVFRECTLYHFRRALTSSSETSLSCFCRLPIAERETDSMIVLWRALIEYIIDQMKISFSECIKSRQEMQDALQSEDGDRQSTERVEPISGFRGSYVETIAKAVKQTHTIDSKLP